MIDRNEEARKLNTVASVELDKARRTIDQLINTCSQSIRDPLKSIRGIVSMMKEEESGKTGLSGQYLDSIENTIMKMDTVINDLHAFLVHSRKTMTVRLILVAMMVEEILGDYRNEIQSGDIKVILSSDQQLPVYTDYNKLRNILSNLISNAIRYQDARKSNHEVRISIYVTGENCNVQIRDNGIGIPDEILPHIFNLFFNGSQTEPGKGVGLYVTQGLVSSLGGELMVESTGGEGSCFAFCIPNLWSPGTSREV